MIYASKPPINADPFPMQYAGYHEAPRRTDPAWDLRRAHDANPILTEFRALRGADWARPERYPDQIATFLRWLNDATASSEDVQPWTDEQRDHARRVLTRLGTICTDSGRNA